MCSPQGKGAFASKPCIQQGQQLWFCQRKCALSPVKATIVFPAVGWRISRAGKCSRTLFQVKVKPL